MSKDYGKLIEKRINRKQPEKKTDTSELRRLRAENKKLKKEKKNLIKELQTTEIALRKTVNRLHELIADQKVEEVIRDINGEAKEEAADIEDLPYGEA